MNTGANKTNPLHELKADQDYFIGLFLTTYQDVMGDMHNLFGRVNEVHVLVTMMIRKTFILKSERLVVSTQCHAVQSISHGTASQKDD